MTVRESCRRLYDLAFPPGSAFPYWLTGLGIAEMKGRQPDYIVCYANDEEAARKFLAKYCTDETPEGFLWEDTYRVIVKYCGPMQLISERPRDDSF